ncbi:MAG TPA: hypothetical protein VHR18_06450 [Solirubrobacterales bacterium]|jgi:hypothetical protein|nr:hypothetical protein [Solirubrobacterales bacterium]
MRLRKFPFAALALLLMLALLSAGCGGGGDDTTAPVEATVEEPTSLTQAELISQGDAICGEVNAAVGAIGSSEGEIAEQTTEAADLYVGMVESIQALGVPSEKDGYSDFSEAAEELAKVEGEVKQAAEDEDTTALGEAATAAAPALEEFQAQAAIYGFEACSEGPSAPTAAPEAGGEGGEVEEGGVEVAPEAEEEVIPEEVAPEEVAPETGGAGGGVEEAPEEAAPETGGGSSGGVGPG